MLPVRIHSHFRVDRWAMIVLLMALTSTVILSGCSRTTSRAISWDADAEQRLLDGKFSEAISICDTKLAAEPQESKAHVIRGRVFMLQGKFEDALAEFTAAQELHPDDVDVQYRRADALRALGRVDESHQQHQQARMRDEKLEAAYSISPSEFYGVPTPIFPPSQESESKSSDESEENPKDAVPVLAGGDSNTVDPETVTQEHDSDLNPRDPAATANQDTPSATESLGGSFTQGQKDRDESRARRQSLTSPSPSLTKSANKSERERGRSGRLGSLAKTESESSEEESSKSDEEQDDADEQEEESDFKPRPVISSALPQSFENGSNQGFGTPGYGTSGGRSRLGTPRVPLTTGLQSHMDKFEPNAEGNLSGSGSAYPTGPSYGNSTANPPTSPYARINPIYAPKKGMLGGIGPAVTLRPPTGAYGGKMPNSESSKKTVLSTSLPGTAPLPSNPSKPGGIVPLSSSLPGTATHPLSTAKPALSSGTSLLPGSTPYKGIPSGNLKNSPTPNP